MEGAGKFVLAILTRVQPEWPAIVAELRGILQEPLDALDDVWTQFEFAMAVVAVEMQALPNLLPADQARRIRQHVLTCLRTPNVGPAKIEAVEAYEQAWTKAMADAELPFGSVAALLCERAGIRGAPVELGGVHYQDPLLLTALGTVVTTFAMGHWKNFLAGPVVTTGGGWWKNFLAAHRIVA